MFALLDYGRGNLRSVEKALQRLGVEVCRVSSGDDFNPESYSAVILPGVGAFGDAMQNLQQRGLVQPVLQWLKEDRPFLGICLGYQLLFEGSEETPEVRGLGFLKGQVVRFPASVGKVPHMGWNQVLPSTNSQSLFRDLADTMFFYHVHSYYPAVVSEECAACFTEYGGVRFSSGIANGNAHAFQFHPEKSQESGRLLLQAFVKRYAKVAV